MHYVTRFHGLYGCSVGSMIQEHDKADRPEQVISSSLQNLGITAVLPNSLEAFINLG